MAEILEYLCFFRLFDGHYKMPKTDIRLFLPKFYDNQMFRDRQEDDYQTEKYTNLVSSGVSIRKLFLDL